MLTGQFVLGAQAIYQVSLSMMKPGWLLVQINLQVNLHYFSNCAYSQIVYSIKSITYRKSVWQR